MGSSIPPIRIPFTADENGVAVAVRELTSQLRGLRTATRGQASETTASARATADLAGRLAAAARATDPFGRGLLSLKNQELQAAQAARTLATEVNPIAAKMSQAASGTELFAQKLRALKSQQEAQAAQQAQAVTSAGLLGKANGVLLSSVKGLVGGYSAVRLAGFINDSIKAAAALHDLSQKTGATVETLSVLEFAGERNGVSSEALGISFRQLAKTLGALRDGNQEATDSFAKLGITAKSLEGLTVDQVFLRVTQSLAGLPDGLEKSEIASALFGRAGSELIPLLNELAEKGFPALAREAANAGAVITTEGAKAADDFKDSLDNLKAAAAGAARTVASPLLPSLTKAAQAMQELFARKPGDTLRHDLEDVAKLLDLLTFKALHLRETLDNKTGQTLADRVIPSPTFTTHPRNPIAAPGAAISDAEIKALAELRSEGVATAAELQRIQEILGQLRKSFANTTDVETRAKLQAQITSLTKEERRERQQLTDSERQALDLLRAQAEEAGRLLKAEQARRQAVQDRLDAEAHAEFKGLAEAGGGAASFEDLIARQRLQDRQTSSALAPLTPTEEIARGRAETEAATLAYVRELQAEGDATIDVFQNIGQSLRENVAGVLDQLFIDGKVNLESFLEAAITGFQKIIDQLLAAKALGGLQDLFSGGIPKAPEGLAGQDVGQLAGLAPSLDTTAAAAQAQASAAALAAAAAGVSAGGAAVSAGAAALGASSAPVAASGAAITAGAGALTGAAAAVAASAAAITAAAAALAAANAAGAVANAAGAAANAAGAAAGGFARGGLAASGGGRRGPGDRLLAWFDPLEFIVNPRATRDNLPLLTALNSGADVPGFAAGGIVGGDGFALPSFQLPTFRTPSAPRVPGLPAGPVLGDVVAKALLDGELRIRHDPGVMVDIMDSNFPMMLQKYHKTIERINPQPR